MTNAYARSRQIPTGVIEARDLRSTDIILIRSRGEVERTPHIVASVSRVNVSDVKIRFTDGTTHVTSPLMRVALA